MVCLISPSTSLSHCFCSQLFLALTVFILFQHSSNLFCFFYTPFLPLPAIRFYSRSAIFKVNLPKIIFLLIPMPPKKNNLNILRQELRSRLLKIGMQIDSKPQAEDRYKVFKKGRGKTEEEDNLPALQSFRSNNLFAQDYRKLVTSNYHNIAEQKQAQQALSK